MRPEFSCWLSSFRLNPVGETAKHIAQTSQVAIANEVFSPGEAEVAQAKRDLPFNLCPFARHLRCREAPEVATGARETLWEPGTGVPGKVCLALAFSSAQAC